MIETIYRERKENRLLADLGFVILSIVSLGYVLLLVGYLITFFQTGPTASNPLSWWFAILGVTVSTQTSFFLLARYLRRLSRFEIPFQAQHTWMLLAAAFCLGIRCVIDCLTDASGAAHAPDGSLAFLLDGSADKYLSLIGMVVFSFCVASILNYCGMLQDDADTIE